MRVSSRFERASSLVNSRKEEGCVTRFRLGQRSSGSFEKEEHSKHSESLRSVERELSSPPLPDYIGSSIICDFFLLFHSFIVRDTQNLNVKFQRYNNCIFCNYVKRQWTNKIFTPHQIVVIVICNFHSRRREIVIEKKYCSREFYFRIRRRQRCSTQCSKPC